MGGCVHTIAVKRSKRVCSSKAGIDEGLKEQSNFTKFHRGQGGTGGGVSLADSSLLISRTALLNKTNEQNRQENYRQTELDREEYVW